MDADWYEDPLDRFDGRFFDGKEWTAKVSAGGELTVDSEFGDPDLAVAEFADPDSILAPAVEQVVMPARRELATASAESPVRVVAVLDPSIRPAPTSDGTASETGTNSNAESPSGNPLWGWLLALLVVAGAALVIAGLISSRSNNDGVQDPVSLDDELQEARVEDLVEGGLDSDIDPDDLQELEEAPAQAPATDPVPDPAEPDAAKDLDVDQPPALAEPPATFGGDEAMPLGSISVLDADSVVSNLSEWHRAFAADQGVSLGPETGCWFAESDGVAAANMYCGPVADEADVLFDAVPVRFEDGFGGHVAQPVIGAVDTAVPLPAGVVLVASDRGPDPPLSFADPQRGGRNSGD